jgi:hypothetical protein
LSRRSHRRGAGIGRLCELTLRSTLRAPTDSMSPWP